MTGPSLIISPIGRNRLAQMHFKKQSEISSNFQRSSEWDDSNKNTARIGDYFAFTHYNDHVTFHHIVDVRKPVERPKLWDEELYSVWAASTPSGLKFPYATSLPTQSQQQKDRQVLVLSPQIMKLSWSEWLNSGGHSRPQGTQRLTLKGQPFIAMLRPHTELMSQCAQLLANVQTQRDELNGSWSTIKATEMLVNLF